MKFRHILVKYFLSHEKFNSLFLEMFMSAFVNSNFFHFKKLHQLEPVCLRGMTSKKPHRYNKFKGFKQMEFWRQFMVQYKKNRPKKSISMKIE